MEALEAVILALGVAVPSVVVRSALGSRASLGMSSGRVGGHVRSVCSRTMGQNGAIECGPSASKAMSCWRNSQTLGEWVSGHPGGRTSDRLMEYEGGWHMAGHPFS